MDAIKYAYKNKGFDGEIYHPIVKATGTEFSKAVDSGYGILKETDFDSPDFVMREYLKRNIWKFSVAKNYNDCIRLSNLLVKEDGSLRSWNEFKREAERVVGDSNRYLKTEYDTIVAGAQMSRLWQEIQRDKHIFPYVQFDVVMDGRTSDICEPLNKLIFAVDDPVLAYYFPPNHFNCRTTVRKLRNGVPSTNYKLPDIPKAFRNNAGMCPPGYKQLLSADDNNENPIRKECGEIFTEENAYIKNTPEDVQKLAEKLYAENYKSLYPAASDEVKIKLEEFKLKYPFYSKVGDINVSLWADRSGIERDILILQRVYDKFKINDPKILPIRNSMIIKKVSNPEYFFDGMISDRKSPTKGNFKKLLQKAKEQKCENIVFDLEENYPYHTENFIRKLSTSFQDDSNYSLIKDFYIVDANDVIYLTREEIKKWLK